MAPFHLALPVTDLAAARRFYEVHFGCRTGRTDERWVDLDFFGHQLTLHQVDRAMDRAPTNGVDGDAVPARHFGVILEWAAWHELAERLRREGVRFLIEPHLRFRGEIGEQATLFLEDPSGNAIEFKAFRDPARVFAAG